MEASLFTMKQTIYVGPDLNNKIMSGTFFLLQNRNNIVDFLKII
jgi:hypothetical protein